MSKELLQIGVTGHVMIEDITPGDELGVILDKFNAIHPMNMSRVIARALANEPNSTIYKIALGSGGTFVDATGDVTFRIPHDGIAPDTAQWQSRLYNQTYYEIVDESSAALGSGPGTYAGGDGAGIAGVRSLRLPSGESQVIVTTIVNAREPTAQVASSLDPSTLNGDFVFDELGLFTAGLSYIATQGYQDVLVGNKTSASLTYLPIGQYVFDITINGETKPISIAIVTSTTTYGQLVNLLNDRSNPRSLHAAGAAAQVTSVSTNTFGALRLISTAVGEFSNVAVIAIATPPTNWLFSNLLNLGGGLAFAGFNSPVPGALQGEEDNSITPARERERLLTHLIFHPLLKSADRSWKITYKLTVVVQRSDSVATT